MLPIVKYLYESIKLAILVVDRGLNGTKLESLAKLALAASQLDLGVGAKKGKKRSKRPRRGSRKEEREVGAGWAS